MKALPAHVHDSRLRLAHVFRPTKSKEISLYQFEDGKYAAAIADRDTLCTDRAVPMPKIAHHLAAELDTLAQEAELAESLITADAPGDLLRQAMDKADPPPTLRQLAKDAGGDPSGGQLSRILHGQTPNPTYNTLERYARALGYRVALVKEVTP